MARAGGGALSRAALATAALAPVLAVQGLAVRRATPRLDGAQGPDEGEVGGAGEPLRLVVLGESTVAGVGARTHGTGLTGQVARALHERTGGAVRWRAVGRIGADAAQTRSDLVPLLDGQRADAVVIALGVNDTIALHSPRRWTADLLRLLIAVRGQVGDARVVLAGVPPMGRFPALPRPLRTVLGLRSAELDAAAARLAGRVPGVRHVPMPVAVLDVSAFCEDRFHPSEAGYRLWAEHLAAAL